MMWDETTHNGRVSFSAQHKNIHPRQESSGQRGSDRKGPRHILYADGDVTSTAAVETILHQVDACVVHPPDKEGCIACVESNSCELIVINVPRPDIEGMNLLTETRYRAPWIPVIMLVDRGQVNVAVKAIKAGAVNCIVRPPDPEYLRSVIAEALRDPKRKPKAPSLTSIELDVLNHFLKGYTNREIARALKRSARTVEVHRSSIMHKLQAEGPVDLVRKAIAAGLADAFLRPDLSEPPASGSTIGLSPSARPARNVHTNDRHGAKLRWETRGSDRGIDAAAYHVKSFAAR